ncbi:GNAT family N-acetyltransferase [Deinococcus sp. RL]|uniref:GNAT family N-acetyltransferase n=1 Tax=Deinococcus sp. RL TaxID=1489678 RepID=UPI000AF64AB3|nr:GNAT family N-acetyltransferase [Deinococcus sp. RL]
MAGAGLTLLEWGPSRGDPQSWRGRIVNVWTEPEFRRRGLARELVTLCLEVAHGRGVTHLSLGTTDAGRALYEELGFRVSGTEMVRRG